MPGRVPATLAGPGSVVTSGYIPAVLRALDDAAVGQWCRAAVEALSVGRARLDDLNVFPVPDGDTGSNLASTLQKIAAGVARIHERHVRRMCAALADEALGGARGNSGAILAQFFADRSRRTVTAILHDYAKWLLRKKWYTGPLRSKT